VSIAAMNWAWAQALPPSSKLVLMALADAADEVGECFPRIRVIARKCCVSERTVQRVIKEFERDNVLIVEKRKRDDGGQTSNLYQLQMRVADKLSWGEVIRRTPSDKLLPPPRHTCHGAGDAVASPQELPTEPSIETTTTCTLLAQPGACAELVMPRLLLQGDKPGVMAFLSGVPEADAQMLLDELEAALEIPGTIKTTPGRWFYGLVQRYAQGKFNPVGAPRIAARRAKANAPVKVDRPAAVDPEVARAHIAKIAAVLHVTTGAVK
jgi:hypothetical protein